MLNKTVPFFKAWSATNKEIDDPHRFSSHSTAECDAYERRMGAALPLHVDWTRPPRRRKPRLYVVNSR